MFTVCMCMQIPVHMCEHTQRSKSHVVFSCSLHSLLRQGLPLNLALTVDWTSQQGKSRNLPVATQPCTGVWLFNMGSGDWSWLKGHRIFPVNEEKD